MAKQILTDCQFFLDGFDLQASMNALGIDYSADIQDQTVFGNTTHVNAGGLKTVTMNHEGLWEGGDNAVDDVLFARVGVNGTVMTVGPVADAIGDPAYFFKCVVGRYSHGAQIGDNITFQVEAVCSDGDLVRGEFLIGQTTAAASANGAGRNVGAVSASQFLHATLHVVAASGSSPTLDVTIESDATNSFSGSETTRATFAEKTAIGAEIITPVAGAITDAWWRAKYVIGGGSPSFTFIVAIGIQ